MKTNTKLFVLGLGLLAFSCDSGETMTDVPTVKEDTVHTDGTKTMENEDSAKTSMSKNGLSLTKVNSPLFAEATLKMEVPEEEKIEAGENKFVFMVEDYKLGVQTNDADIKMCANSAKGQHIHFIMDNEPYKAYYDTVFMNEVAEGNHVLLAFVSRSYHESVKSESAYVLTKFSTGDSMEDDSVDLSAAHMFYSRPKGTYSGTDTKKVLLDFYLVNTELSKDGNYVTATINGETSFDIYTWEPYFIEGLPMGENTIKLELKDEEGNLIESPYNPVERIVTLEEGDKA